MSYNPAGTVSRLEQIVNAESVECPQDLQDCQYECIAQGFQTEVSRPHHATLLWVHSLAYLVDRMV